MLFFMYSMLAVFRHSVAAACTAGGIFGSSRFLTVLFTQVSVKSPSLPSELLLSQLRASADLKLCGVLRFLPSIFLVGTPAALAFPAHQPSHYAFMQMQGASLSS